MRQSSAALVSPGSFLWLSSHRSVRCSGEVKPKYMMFGHAFFETLSEDLLERFFALGDREAMEKPRYGACMLSQQGEIRKWAGHKTST